MKKTILGIFCALLIQASPVYTANWSPSNPFVEMMRSMLNMFEMMQLYQNFSGYSNLSGRSQPFSPGAFPSGQLPSGQFPSNQFGSMPFAQSDTDSLPTTPSNPAIDGLWFNEPNTLLLINGDYAQIYWSRTQYRSYYLSKSSNQLTFKDAQTGQQQVYDMATQADQLVLRDKQGKQLLFRKLNTR